MMARSNGATDAGPASEQTPLLGGAADANNNPSLTTRHKIYLILEGRYGTIGAVYEKITIFLILASILSFVIGSLFDPVYNADADYLDMCGKVCDAIFFGQNPDNGKSMLCGVYSLILFPAAQSSFINYYLKQFIFNPRQDWVSLASGSLPHRWWRWLPSPSLLSTTSFGS